MSFVVSSIFEVSVKKMALWIMSVQMIGQQNLRSLLVIHEVKNLLLLVCALWHSTGADSVQWWSQKGEMVALPLKFMPLRVLFCFLGGRGFFKFEDWTSFVLLFISDDLIPDGHSDLYSLPPDSQSEIVEEDDVVNPYPITFPVRKISVPTKLVSKEKKNEEKTG